MPVTLLRLMMLVLLACCAPAPHPAATPGVISVEARPIDLNPADPAQIRVGRLHYLGGLHLQSADLRFGGLSGLRWHGGTLYAVSDGGDWITLEPIEQGAVLTGIGRVRMQRLFDLAGNPLHGKAAGDAESLNLNFWECETEPCDPQSVSIAFERDHRVWTYPLWDGMPQSQPVAADMPRDWLYRLPVNGGMEAIAGTGYLELFAAEQLRTPNGAASVLVLHNGGESDVAADRWEEVEMPVAEGFSSTDADYLDGTSFLILFRRYSLMAGVAVRVEEVTVTIDAAGRPRITSRPLAALAPPLSVDNMEGLAVRREGGRVFVYLVSDDNFSGAQRTLLMKFELLPK